MCNLSPFMIYLLLHTEYGVLHSMHCRKFKLDKHSPNERYGLHTDGKLHINNLMYSVDDYCVEFTKMEAIEVSFSSKKNFLLLQSFLPTPLRRLSFHSS